MMNYFHRFSPKSQCGQDLRRPFTSRFLKSNRGQALIEYLLMVVVMVILIVGLTLAFFQPFQVFLEALNKTYIKCLLETGELPRTQADSVAVCDAEIPSFQMKNIDGSDPSKGKPDRDKYGENTKGESSSSDGEKGTGADSSVGGNGATSGSQTRKSTLIRDGMKSNGRAKSELGGEKTTNIPVDNFEAGEGFMKSNAGGAFANRGSKKTKKIDLSGLSEYERKKITREAEKSRSIALDSESFTQKKNKKIIVKPPPEKNKVEDLNVNTDFGYYFKIFFIIVLILFIIILMGSQAMQMTNSSDN